MHATTSRPTIIRSWTLPDWIGLGGAVAGALAGLVMVILSPLLSLLSGVSLWEPPKLIAATLLGQSALSEPGFDLVPVVSGTAIHFVVSILLGILFSVVTHRVLHLTTDFGLPIYIGLCYGLLIFFIAYFVILPSVNPALVESNSGMGPILAQNVVFGLCLGVFYLMVRPEPYTDTAVDKDIPSSSR